MDGLIDNIATSVSHHNSKGCVHTVACEYDWFRYEPPRHNDLHRHFHVTLARSSWTYNKSRVGGGVAVGILRLDAEEERKYLTFSEHLNIESSKRTWSKIHKVLHQYR